LQEAIQRANGLFWLCYAAMVKEVNFFKALLIFFPLYIYEKRLRLYGMGFFMGD
jgi:hypothetical protein